MGWEIPDTEQSVEGKDCQASSTEQSVTGANRKARLKGKRLQPDLPAVVHPGFRPVHSSAVRPASVRAVG